MQADFFTTAVRTGDGGSGGVSLLLIPRSAAGVSVRRMETQFDSSHSTTMVTLEDVVVPEDHLIGQEGLGFKVGAVVCVLVLFVFIGRFFVQYITENFNHERWLIAVAANRQSRECYREAFEWALKRETFGKALIKSQIIRAKLADMSRQVRSC